MAAVVNQGSKINVWIHTWATQQKQNMCVTFIQYWTNVEETQNICLTFIQYRPNVFDVGPILHKCQTNVLCLLGDDPHPWCDIS